MKSSSARTLRCVMKAKRCRWTRRAPSWRRSMTITRASQLSSDATPENALSPLCRTAHRICAAPARRNGAAGNTTAAFTSHGRTEARLVRKCSARSRTSWCTPVSPVFRRAPRPGRHGCRRDWRRNFRVTCSGLPSRTVAAARRHSRHPPPRKSRTGLVRHGQAERRGRL